MNRQSALNHDSLAQRAYHLLAEKLVTLALPPGSIVSEGELIEMTGFGRTPVREAIQRLAHQGFFDIVPRSGLLVTPVTRSNMLHILEARKPLERLIIYRASLNATDAQRSDLAAISRELTTTHDRFEAFMKQAHILDELLNTCARNPFAAAAVSPLRGHCRRLLFFHRQGMQLTDSISASSKMAHLIARREYRGAQKASDGRIAVLERMVSSVGRMD